MTGPHTIELRSDNSAGIAPRILDAIASVNTASALAYGGDEVTAELEAVVREVFEHRGARVFPVTSGTAANALALSAMTPPWGAVWCHHTAHIIVNEAGATSALSGGAVMVGVGGDNFQIDPTVFRTGLDGVRWGDNHQSQPAVLSITQPTDFGTVYSVEHVASLAAIAKQASMATHLDGARFANALVRLGCSPADATWRAGITTLTLGATKNGAMSAEAIITFDEAVADELVYRTKRAGHVTSKMRYQSAQLIAYLADGYWLELAANSNERMSELESGLSSVDPDGRLGIVNRVDANMMFLHTEDAVANKLADAGLMFYRMGDSIRFVTNWSTARDDIARVLTIIADAVADR